MNSVIDDTPANFIPNEPIENTKSSNNIDFLKYIL